MKSHGLTKNRQEPREYWIWVGIRQRCNNPNNWAFKWYGGRGIKVCDRWSDAAMFLSDMGPRPSPKHSIERIDNDGNYEPGNCEWVNALTQANNRRNAVRLDGMTILEVAGALGMSYSGVYTRLSRGWTLEEIATTAKSDGVLRSTNRLITAGGITKPMSVWAREAGITSTAILSRLKRGWSPESAVKPNTRIPT